MLRVSPEPAPWTRVQMCPTCGYRGRRLQGARADEIVRCPSCRADLYARPPRSYLEMEGFDPPVRAEASGGVVVRTGLMLRVRLAIARVLARRRAVPTGDRGHPRVRIRPVTDKPAARGRRI